VDPTVDPPGRSITIDRARKARIRRDAVLRTITTPAGLRRLAMTGVALGFLGLLARGWLTAAVRASLAIFGRVAWRWLQVQASLRTGLDVGQTVRVDYASSGEISITDSTGQYWLPRGSVIAVLRYRGIVTVVGREISFILPGELLTAADIAFLEGHGTAPQEATAAGPDLSLSCEVTPDVQRNLVTAATLATVRSADFLLSWFVSALLVGVVGYVGSGPALAGTVLFCGLLVLPGLHGVFRTRRGLRAAYPVGLTVRAEVTKERLLLSPTHGTRTIAWRDYAQLRLTKDALLLRHARRRLALDATIVLPITLFDTNARATISAVVHGRF
jgi:hypothetical protein